MPYEAFDAQDGPFLICCGNDRLFAKLAAVLDRPAWVSDPHYATNRARLDHKQALLEMLSTLLRVETRATWIARFEAVGIPCSPIHSVPEALAQPQVAALGLRQSVPGEDYTLTGLPLSFDGHRPELVRSAPRLGGSNAEFGIPLPASKQAT